MMIVFRLNAGDARRRRGGEAVVPAKDFKRRMVVEIDGAPHMIEQITVQTPRPGARRLSTKSRPAT
jgi:hypothetical protein